MSVRRSVMAAVVLGCAAGLVQGVDVPGADPPGAKAPSNKTPLPKAPPPPVVPQRVWRAPPRLDPTAYRRISDREIIASLEKASDYLLGRVDTDIETFKKQMNPGAGEGGKPAQNVFMNSR